MKRAYGVLLVIILLSGGCASVMRTSEKQAPQNVIIMIGDGMGVGQIEIGRLFEYGKEGRLYLQSLPKMLT